MATLIHSKLADLRARIRDLALLKIELHVLIERSHRLDPADCTDADICHILHNAVASPQVSRSAPVSCHRRLTFAPDVISGTRRRLGLARDDAPKMFLSRSGS